ncbi:hypothetical protein [uncultured Aquabacterium sp.]|uniref:hypothetical protein n=1 Tax=Aquabacterium sp. TaxID=1872578 RepID=UPI0025DCD462|nr:hypothetical protein [uncultured Aquabacterium sp.]
MSWLDEIDFTARHRRASVWGWAMLGLSLLMVLMVSDDAARIEQVRRDGEEEVRRLERALAQASAAPRRPSRPLTPDQPHAAGVPTLQKGDWRQAVEMAEALAHDPIALLDRVDERAGRLHVVLTGLRFTLASRTTGGDGTEVVLQAAVPDDRTALAWVDSLGPQARLHRRQRLTVPVSDGVRQHVWRVDVTWPEAQR